MLGRLKGKSKRITTATARTCCRIVGAMLKLTQYCPDETAVVHFSDFSFTWVLFLNQHFFPFPPELGIIEPQALPLEITEQGFDYFGTHFPRTLGNPQIFNMLKWTLLPGVTMYFISSCWKRDQIPFFLFAPKKYFNQWVQWKETSHFFTFSAHAKLCFSRFLKLKLSASHR